MIATLTKNCNRCECNFLLFTDATKTLSQVEQSKAKFSDSMKKRKYNFVDKLHLE